MKVYIVFYADSFDDWRLEKVFDTEEKAEKYLKGKSSSYSYFEADVE
jgi:hypothetical protein